MKKTSINTNVHKTLKILEAEHENVKVDKKVFMMTTHAEIESKYQHFKKMAEEKAGKPQSVEEIHKIIDSIEKDKQRQRGILISSKTMNLIPTMQDLESELDETPEFKFYKDLYNSCKEELKEKHKGILQPGTQVLRRRKTLYRMGKDERKGRIIKLMIKRIQDDLKAEVKDFHKLVGNRKSIEEEGDEVIMDIEKDFKDRMRSKELYGWLKVNSKFKLLRKFLKQRIIEIIDEVRKQMSSK